MLAIKMMKITDVVFVDRPHASLLSSFWGVSFCSMTTTGEAAAVLWFKSTERFLYSECTENEKIGRLGLGARI